MENAGYLFTGFALVWALVLGYVVVLFARQRRLQREVQSLKEAGKEGPAGGNARKS